ncbi:twin-arginine translocase subunit TatC [Iamia majanohamensis]|uniref:Sec-independent protein translocase protein TatC n=1 Tax=Iamia majanohamensis TaxID=467976 RepID=A0AAF0BXL0_9ACTN|nr:twin-arginine translocase subunit TatC [Iamia majanohamensis]WCO69220.1 twin-arginine translocase subunit TatC [Iamia majanohamensis]
MSAETAPRTESQTGHMTLVDHITELRTRIVRALIAVALGSLVAWFLYQPIFDLLLGPLRETAPDDNLVNQLSGGALLADGPLTGFQIRIQLTTYAGIMFAMPVILWQIWKFVSPGLYDNEKRYGVTFITVGTALFATGAAIAFWTLPKALEFLQEIGGDGNFVEFYTPQKYLKLIVFMMLAFGIGFEFPLLVTTLNVLGAVTTDTLRRIRRYVIVIVAVFVAVATPSGDPISMLALTIPMCLLYEVSIIIGRVRDRRRRKAEAAAAA